MRRSSAAAVVAALTAFIASAAVAAPVARAVSPPQPVSNVQAFQDDNDVIVAEWMQSPDADEAVLCWSVGDTAPTTPVPTSTTSCDRPTSSVTDRFQGDDAITYSVSVFSYRSSDGASGSPVSRQLTTTPQRVPPVDIVATAAVGAHSLQLQWHNSDVFNDVDGPFDVSSWVIREQRGITPPSMHRHPVKVVPAPNVVGATATIGGLKPGVPYAFTVVARASDGRLGQPDSTIAATRAAGSHVSSTRHGRWIQHLLPGSDGLSGSVAARVQSTGRTEALYTSTKVNPGFQPHSRLRLIAGEVGAGWTSPTTVFRNNIDPIGLQLARSPDGTLLATWQNNDATADYRIRPAGSHWQAVRQLPAFQSAFLAITLDEHDRVHAVVEENDTLRYATYAHGSWTFQRLPDTSQDVAIAYDRSRHRVVVAAVRDSRSGRATLSIATAPETTKRLGRWHTVLKRSSGSHGTVIDAPSVAATDGRIIVGATLVKERDDEQVANQPVDHAVIRSSGLVVATGTSPAQMGRPVIIGGTGPTDSGLRVTLAGPRRLVAVWTRRTNAFKPSDGAYELEAHARGAHAWSFGKARQVLAGHYTFAVVGALAASGRPVVVTRTLSRDTIVDE
jgi:hypothetical protein